MSVKYVSCDADASVDRFDLVVVSLASDRDGEDVIRRAEEDGEPVRVYERAEVRHRGNVFRGNEHDLRAALARWAVEQDDLEVRGAAGALLHVGLAHLVLVLAHYPAEG